MGESPRSGRVASLSVIRMTSAIERIRAQVSRRRRLLLGLTLAGMAAAVVWVAVATPDGRDAHAYYVADLDHLYSRGALSADAYLYPPLLAELIQPLRALPFPAFVALVRAGNIVALGIAAGPFTGPLLLTLPISDDLGFGNINLWLGLLIVAGLRWPALWSGVLLTKITPGVGVLWFVGRRDRRGLLIALGATVAVAAVAAVFAPRAWSDWLAFLNSPSSDPRGLLGATFLPLRLIVAAVLATWAGYRNAPWALVLASWSAVPLLEPGTYAILTPLLWFLWRQRTQAPERATGSAMAPGVESAAESPRRGA
jgi:hypothetical protein